MLSMKILCQEVLALYSSSIPGRGVGDPAADRAEASNSMDLVGSGVEEAACPLEDTLL